MTKRWMWSWEQSARYVEALAIAGARADPRPDKSDWIRIWVAVRRVQGQSVDSEDWRHSYDA